jgi:hypothetical protein
MIARLDAPLAGYPHHKWGSPAISPGSRSLTLLLFRGAGSGGVSFGVADGALEGSSARLLAAEDCDKFHIDLLAPGDKVFDPLDVEIQFASPFRVSVETPVIPKTFCTDNGCYEQGSAVMTCQEQRCEQNSFFGLRGGTNLRLSASMSVYGSLRKQFARSKHVILTPFQTVGRVLNSDRIELGAGD